MPDDQNLNRWLEDNYGRTVDGRPLFRLIWSTDVREHRHSTFVDFYGEVFLREVTETREVLKYPFAQDRWVLERIHLVSDSARELYGLRTEDKYSYEEVYIFQDREGNFLPLSQEKVETAMYLFFKFYLQMTREQRIDMRMALLAKKDLERRNKYREIAGQVFDPNMHTIVLERVAGIDRSERRKKND